MKIFLLTHYDLDGVVSYIVAKNAIDIDSVYKSGYERREDKVNSIIKDAKEENPDILIVTDFILEIEHLKKLKKVFKKIIYIDHHPDSINNKNEIEKLCYKTSIKEEESGALLVFNLFRNIIKKKVDDETYINIKKLAIIASDYDLWQHKYKVSRHVDVLFWYYHKWNGFIRRFGKGYEGYEGLSVKEKEYVEQYDKDLKEIFKEMDMFTFPDDGEDQHNAIFFVSDQFLINNLTLFEPHYNYYFGYNDVRGKLDVRLRERDSLDLNIIFDKILGNHKDKIVSAGGHPHAGTIIFKPKYNTMKVMYKFVKAFHKYGEKFYNG